MNVTDLVGWESISPWMPSGCVTPRDVYGVPPLTYNIHLDIQSISVLDAPPTSGLESEIPGGVKLKVMPNPTSSFRSAPHVFVP